MRNQQRINRHVAAGNQLAVLRHAAHQLSATVHMMGEEAELDFPHPRTVKDIIVRLQGQVEALEKILGDQLRQEMLNGCSDTTQEGINHAINAIYHHAPPFTREILPAHNGGPAQQHMRSILSPDYQRAVTICYLLAERDTENEHAVKGVAFTSGDADFFLDGGNPDCFSKNVANMRLALNVSKNMLKVRKKENL